MPEPYDSSRQRVGIRPAQQMRRTWPTMLTAMKVTVGCCVGNQTTFETNLAASLRRVAPTVPMLTRTNQRSIFTAYNSVLDEASEGAVALIHEDVEITDTALVHK